MAAAAASKSQSNTSTIKSSLPYLLLSFSFHLLYLSSIFQIYFTSPVVHPSNRFSLIDTYPSVSTTSTRNPPLTTLEQSIIRDSKPPAERLVLIVGDGLRADTVFGRHDWQSLPHWIRFGLMENQNQDRDGNGENSSFPKALSDDRSLSQAQEKRIRNYESDKFKDGGKGRYQVAPYIRRMALEKGAWGISHTRVPTESRPGHVAMIAGMYEDVSAVTKGWKQNPLPFDSVLNQSANTFAFGSPDIVPMFSRGATEGKVRQWCYREEDEDFTRDATHLDLWVLNEFRNLLESSKSSPSLTSTLKERGNIFFLHLLGPDTTGHTYRPFSPEYLGNTMVVDSIVKEVERLMKDHFKDEKTAFVFTADHGMSKLGNHGDGESDNTRTPLVVWGSGVRKPRLIGEGEGVARKRFGSDDEQDEKQSWRVEERAKDEYFRGWDGFDEVWREDVEQGDITPLMASLLSLPQPANSEGRLPLDYFDPALGEEHKARASLTNALQVLESYRVKDAQRSSRSLSYQPFPALAPGPAPLFRIPGSQQVSQIKAHIATKQYSKALVLCDELITSSLEGAQYLQTYDWLLLVSIVTLGYLGSVFYGIVFISRKYALLPQELESCPESLGLGSAISFLGLSVISLKFFLEKSPITYYLYAVFPTFFWGRVIDQRKVFWILLQRLVSCSSPRSSSSSTTNSFTIGKVINALSKLIVPLILSIFALELMVIGYLHRIAWTIGFFGLGFLWPFWGWSSETRKRNEALVIAWGGVCTVTAMFTLAGTEKEESRIGLALSGLVFLIAGMVILNYPSLFLSASDENGASRLRFWKAPARVVSDSKSSSTSQKEVRQLDPHLERTIKVLGGELVILVISTLVTLSSSRSLQLKKGLPLSNQLIGWGVLVSCLTLPFVLGFQSPIKPPSSPQLKIPQPISQRLTIFIFAFAPVFVLLSLRDETLFFFSYIATLLLWSKVEGTLCEESQRERTAKEVEEKQRNGVVNGKVEEKKEKEITAGKTRTLRSSEIRTSLTFLFLLHVGFFGTGNVASISSFYLSPVYRLVPIFNPFLMATLLLLKILVPFVILSSIFQVLCLSPTRRPPQASYLTENPQANRKLRASLMEGPELLGKNSSGGLGLRDSFSLTLIACIAADVLALNFLFTVRTDGSWLEIGRTITHFAMSNLLQIFMLALATLSEIVMGKGNLNL